MAAAVLGRPTDTRAPRPSAGTGLTPRCRSGSPNPKSASVRQDLRAGLRRGLGLASRSLPHCCTINSIRQSLLLIAERTSSAKAESGTENVKSLPVSLLRRPRPDSLAAINTATNVATACLRKSLPGSCSQRSRRDHTLSAAADLAAASVPPPSPLPSPQSGSERRLALTPPSATTTVVRPGIGRMPSMSMSLCLREVLQPLLRPLSPKPQSLPAGMTPPLPPRPQPLPAGTDATAAAEAEAEAEAEAGYPASPAVASATDAARRPGRHRHRRGCGCGCGCTDIVLRAGRSRGSPRTISAVPTCTGLGSYCQSWSP
jgi:hypothetical protein